MLDRGFAIMAYSEAVLALRDDADPEVSRLSHDPLDPDRGGAQPDSLVTLICSYPWPCDQAVRVFACESVNFRPDVVYGPTVSPTNDRGISQTNAVHAGKYAARGWDYYTDAFDPVKNLTVAYQIYEDNGGFSPWSCAR